MTNVQMLKVAAMQNLKKTGKLELPGTYKLHQPEQKLKTRLIKKKA